MRNLLKPVAVLALTALAVAASGLAGAQPDTRPMMGMPGHGMTAAHGGRAMMHGAGHGKGHLFGPHWRETLSDDQKAEIDWMHLRLRQEQYLVDAGIALKKAEINRLIVSEDVDQEKLRAKIDELLELERKRLVNRYQHMIEMRQVLTPQQRVSFDLGILARDRGHRK